MTQLPHSAFAYGRVHVDGRMKSQSDSVFFNVDTIHEAMRLHRKLSFLYYKHDERTRRKLQHGGKPPLRAVFHPSQDRPNSCGNGIYALVDSLDENRL